MDLRIRLLYEITPLETLGLTNYIRKLFERRWTDVSLRGGLFAVVRSTMLPNPPMFLEPTADTFKNPAVVCTIIVLDLGNPTVLVVMNRAYAFIHHCLAEIPCDSTNVPISIIGRLGSNDNLVEIIAIDQRPFIPKDIVSSALNIPCRLKRVVEEILRLQNAQILNCVPCGMNSDCYSFLFCNSPSSVSSCLPIDLSPWSHTRISQRCFGWFEPGIWSPLLRCSSSPIVSAARCIDRCSDHRSRLTSDCEAVQDVPARSQSEKIQSTDPEIQEIQKQRRVLHQSLNSIIISQKTNSRIMSPIFMSMPPFLNGDQIK